MAAADGLSQCRQLREAVNWADDDGEESGSATGVPGGCCGWRVGICAYRCPINHIVSIFTGLGIHSGHFRPTKGGRAAFLDESEPRFDPSAGEPQATVKPQRSRSCPRPAPTHHHGRREIVSLDEQDVGYVEVGEGGAPARCQFPQKLLDSNIA
jgi:hypothetical protein